MHLVGERLRSLGSLEAIVANTTLGGGPGMSRHTSTPCDRRLLRSQNCVHTGCAEQTGKCMTQQAEGAARNRDLGSCQAAGLWTSSLVQYGCGGHAAPTQTSSRACLVGAVAGALGLVKAQPVQHGLLRGLQPDNKNFEEGGHVAQLVGPGLAGLLGPCGQEPMRRRILMRCACIGWSYEGQAGPSAEVFCRVQHLGSNAALLQLPGLLQCSCHAADAAAEML